MPRMLVNRLHIARRAAALVCALGLALPVPAQDAPDAGAVASVWHVRSPYPTIARTLQLVDLIGLRLLSDYQASGDAAGWAGRPGVERARRHVKRMPGGTTRVVEIAIAPYPEGGHELYLQGQEEPGGRPNPELGAIGKGVEELIASIQAEQAEDEGKPPDLRSLDFHVLHLSYIQVDRALGLLKALGYTAIEYEQVEGESIFERIFNPLGPEQRRLPVLVKMIDAPKTSLMERPPGEYEAVGTSEVLPDLGGVYLHDTTSGGPQQRLMVVYDPADPGSLESLLRLVREKIDLPARQILIEALVIELDSDRTRDIGVSWRATGVTKSDRDYNDAYDASLITDNEDDNNPFTFLFNRTGVADLFSFQASIRALVEKGDAEILSSPSVLVLDGRQAKIQIGNKIPVVQTTLTQTGVAESVVYFPVGIVLNLRPRLSEDAGEVVMQVETVVSSVRSFTLTGSQRAVAPEVESRQVQTFVRVANDTPFIIGGLTARENSVRDLGIPGLSQIPILGHLFKRTTTTNQKREVIIVVTPHVVPLKEKDYSYVIPQEAPIFDSFGNKLFRNAYRLREQDLFDLDFLYQSRAWRRLQDQAREHAAAQPPGWSAPAPVARLLKGGVPGEEVLVRRMLWEIIRRTDYMRFIDLDRVIFFEEDPQAADGSGFHLAYLRDKLPPARLRNRAVVLSFDARAEGTPLHPFVQPRAAVTGEDVTAEGYLSLLSRHNRRGADGEPETWSIALSDAYTGTASPVQILKGVLVLKRLLDLNSDLPLEVGELHPGRQILFPTEADLRDRFHLIDPEAARLFYEVTSYYPAFEREFKVQAEQIGEMIGGPPSVESESGALRLLPGAPESITPVALVAAAAATTPVPLPPPAPARAVEPAGSLAEPDASVGADAVAELRMARSAVLAEKGAGAAAAREHYDLAHSAFADGRTSGGWLELAEVYIGQGRKTAAQSLLKRAEQGTLDADLREAVADAWQRAGNPRAAARLRGESSAKGKAAEPVTAAAAPGAAPARAKAEPAPARVEPPASVAPASGASGSALAAAEEELASPVPPVDPVEEDLRLGRQALEAAPAETRPEAQRRYDEAASAFRDGRPSEGYLGLGRLYLRLKLHNVALYVLRKAGDMAPAEPEVQRALGVAYLRAGNEGEARRHLALGGL